MKRSIAILSGLSIAFGVAAGYLPGGFDALAFYFRQPPTNAVSPAWLYLVTVPFSWFPWPVSWQLFTAVSVFIAGLAAMAWVNRTWWALIFSAAFLWNLWLGQIEVFQLAGLLFGWMVLNKKAHPALLGIAWMCFATKPQSGLGPALLITWWFWRERGSRAMLAPIATALAVFVLSLVLWPGWISRWMTALLDFSPTPSLNAAVWPYGWISLLALGLLPYASGRVQSLRIVAAVTLLAGPYFSMYHCTTLLALSSPIGAVISWAIVILTGNAQAEYWMPWAWILPVSLLAFDVGLIVLKLRRPQR